MCKSLILILAVGMCLVFYGQAFADGAQSPDTCESMMPGDANSNGTHGVTDAVFLIEYLCNGGPAPEPLANGDYNGDCIIDSTDVYGSFMYLWKCKEGAKCGYDPPVECTCVEPATGDYFQDPCFGYKVGDANNDGIVHIGDAVRLINYVFKDGTPPRPFEFFSGDANCDCSTNLGDAVFIINFVFRGGSSPCNCDTWVESCNGCIGLAINWMFLFE